MNFLLDYFAILILEDWTETYKGYYRFTTNWNVRNGIRSAVTNVQKKSWNELGTLSSIEMISSPLQTRRCRLDRVLSTFSIGNEAIYIFNLLTNTVASRIKLAEDIRDRIVVETRIFSNWLLFVLLRLLNYLLVLN